MDNFNFTAWAALYKTDKALFEEKRLAIIEKTITAASVSQQQCLRGLQFQIDGIRLRTKNPYYAALKISATMMRSVDALCDSMRELCGHLLTPYTARHQSKAPTKNATILPFRAESSKTKQSQNA